MKLIVAGSRDFEDYALVCKELDNLHEEIREIVSGVARGADLLGEQWARSIGKPIKQFPADWDTHGKSAGYKRNIQMGHYGTHLLVFWDGESKGTSHMINIAQKAGLWVKIVYFNN